MFYSFIERECDMAKKNSGQYQGLNGIKGGYAVKNMIREVQKRMAEGTLQISAKPTDEMEVVDLAKTRELNLQSRQNSTF